MVAIQTAPYRVTYPAWRFDPQEAGLVAAWRLSPQGQTVYDLTANGYNLSTVGAPCYQRGPLGDGMYFEGAASYLARTVANFRSTDTKGTIEVVFKYDAINAPRQLFCSSDAPGWNNRLDLELYSGATSVKRVRLYQIEGGAANCVEATTDLYPNLWYHLVLVSTGTAWSMYLNGVAQTLSVILGSNNGNWFADTTARDNITIGAMVAGGTTGYLYGGAINSIRVYNTDQSSAWVAREYAKLKTAGFAFDYGVKTTTANVSATNQLSNSGFTVQSGTFSIVDDTIADHWSKPDNGIDPTDSSLICGYYMNPDGTTVYDVSSNGHNGTTAGSPISARECVGRVLNFDGVDDQVGIPGINNTGGNYTFEFWAVSSMADTDWTSLLYHDPAGAFYWHIQWHHTTGIGWKSNTESGQFGATPRDGLWHHIALTFDNTAHLSSCYLDGVKYGIDYAYSGYTIVGTIAVAGNMQFAGKIHSFALHSEAKSLSWIQAQYAKTAPRLLANRPVKAIRCNTAGSGELVFNSLCHSQTTPTAAYGQTDFWVKTMTAAAWPVWYYTIAAEAMASTSEDLRVFIDTNGRLGIERSGVAVVMRTVNGFFPTNQWVKITVRRYNSGLIYLYMNDVLVDVTGGSGTNPATSNVKVYSNYTRWYSQDATGAGTRLCLSDQYGKYRLTKGVLP